jgi:glycosyltransferase involved in cell wall biosynthesis
MAERSDIYHDARVLKEAGTLTDAGYEVSIIGLRGVTENLDKNYPFKVNTYYTISRRYRPLRNAHLFLLILFINIKLVFQKADIYHAHNTFFLISMWLASKLFKGKLVFDSHEVQWELNKIAAFLEKSFIRKADHVINVSEGRALAQAKRYNIDLKKITIISNYPVINDRKISFEKNTDGVKFIFSGGFDLQSNKLDNFIKVLHNFPKISFDLMAFGYGTNMVKLERLINELDLEKQVKFIPLVSPDQVLSTISRYDFSVNLLINPNDHLYLNHHGINKIYEYLGAGLPIFCSDLPSFESELVQNGVGISTDPTSLESIEKSLTLLLEKTPEEIVVMKEKALFLSQNRFNWGTQATKLTDLYHRLTQQE